MKIVIENIALIKKAEIELNGVTVVAGLNKTGKTTIGKALYTIISAYKNLPLKVLRSKKNSVENAVFTSMQSNKKLLRNIPIWLVADEFVDAMKDKDLIEWAVDKEHKGVGVYIDRWVHSKEEYEEYIPKKERDIIFKRICDVLERPDEIYEEFLIESFARNLFKQQINSFYNNSKGKIAFSSLENELKVEFIGNELSYFSKNILSDTSAIYIESINLLDLLQMEGKARRSPDGVIGKFSQPAADCTKMLDQMPKEDRELYEEYEESEKIREIIGYIVEKVTHGSLKNDSSGISFMEEEGQKPVELSNLSAGLKVFVVIQTLLENGSLRKGDFLLIDEPEVNLHPEWQIVLAEVLVLLHKELGIIIYVNSHSPYFIRAIEVKLAQNDMTLKGKFYLTVLDDDLCHVEDVSQETERIYELLYKPLEEL